MPARPLAAILPTQQGGGTLQREWDAVLGEEAALIRKVEEAQAARATATNELNQLQEQLDEATFELFMAQAALDDAQEEATARAAELDAAQDRLEVAIERLRAQIVSTYIHGGDTTYLSAVLNATNGEDVSNAAAYSRAVVGDTQKLADELEEARRVRAEAEAAARRVESEAAELRTEVSAVHLYIAGARDNQTRLVDEISFNLMVEHLTLREVQGRKAVIEGRINSLTIASDGVAQMLAQIQRNQPDWRPGEIRMTNPLPGRRISSQFGMRHHPILDITRLHAGGDIGAPTGTALLAAGDGVVVVASERGGYGLTVVIDHGHSLATLYGHMSQISVNPGQQVRRGDVIGRVGSTGLSTGPHLHLETRIKGMPIDPMGVIDFDAPLERD